VNWNFYSKRAEVQTHSNFEYIDITQLVQNEIQKSQILNGIVVVNVLHTTAALVLQESDPTVHEDAQRVLEDLVPTRAPYAHCYEGSVNGAAHQRQQVLGSVSTIPMIDGDLVLGTWQRIFLVELFRPMLRQIQISIFGSK
jgi:secondary thiamine-phosphate synthase enzyme